jgi:hypothetical protein
MKRISILISLVILFSCTNRKDKINEAPIARVFDEYLYPSDLKGVIPDNLNVSDSISIARDYIDNWIRKKLILYKAEENLTDDEKNIERQIEDLRTSLLIYKYEQNVLENKLDTIISNSEIEKYYNENMSNFLLDNTIVKALYIKVPRKAPKIYKVRRWYRSDDQEDVKELESYCYENATNYDYFDDDWIDFSTILDKIPLQISNEEWYLKNRENIEIRDSTYYYFVRIKNYKLAGTVAPLEIENDNIKSILLNKRRIKMIQKLESSIYNDAYNRRHFNIY